MTTCLIHIRISSQMQERATRRRPFQDSVSISHEGYIENCLIIAHIDGITNLVAPHNIATNKNLRRMCCGN